MWLASGRASCGPNTAATSSACSKPSSSAASQRVVGGRRVLGEERHVLAARQGHHPVARAAVRELALVDLVHDRAVAARRSRASRPSSPSPRSGSRARGRSRWARTAVEHLVEVARAVQHRDGDGDDGSRAAPAAPDAVRTPLEHAGRVAPRSASRSGAGSPRATSASARCPRRGPRQYSSVRLEGVLLLQLGPEPVALLSGRERLLGAAGALLGIRDRLAHSSSAIRGASRLNTQKPSTNTPTHDRARDQQVLDAAGGVPRVRGASRRSALWRDCTRIVASGLNHITRCCSCSAREDLEHVEDRRAVEEHLEHHLPDRLTSRKRTYSAESSIARPPAKSPSGSSSSGSASHSARARRPWRARTRARPAGSGSG